MSDQKQVSAEVKTSKKGPIIIKGNFEIISNEGKKLDVSGKEAYLCACGHSNSKPFCDGSHKK